MKPESEQDIHDYFDHLLHDLPKPKRQLQRENTYQVETKERLSELEALLQQTEVASKLQLEQQLLLPEQVTTTEHTRTPFKAVHLQIGGMWWVAPLYTLGGIFSVNSLTPLFGYAPWMLGVTAYQERIISVIDFITLFKLKKQKSTGIAPFVVLLDDTNFGLVCDDIGAVEDIVPEDIQWASENRTRDWLAGYTREGLTSVLDVKSIVACIQG